MSTNTIGEKLRQLREQHKLPLRKVAAMLDVDVAILSKMERGERKLTKGAVQKLAEIYQFSASELMVLYLSDRIFYEVKDEEMGEEALKVAEDRLRYLKSER